MEESGSKTKSVTSKSWTHNRTTETDTKKAFVRPPCPYCKSWMNAPEYGARARANRTSAPNQEKSPNNRRNLNVKSAETPAQAPHLKYGMFGQKKSATSPKSKDAEKSKSPMKQTIKDKVENEESDEIKIVSKTSSPLFSIRSLDDQDKSKFSASHTNCIDVDALRLVTTASP